MRKISEEFELENGFYFDAITGIWNRYYFGVHDAEYRNGDEKYPVGAIYITLGGIREVNETKGFSQGDEYIKKFADTLVAEFGKNACYRMSGSEFLVLLERQGEEDAKAEYEALEDLLISQNMTYVSAGYAWADTSEALESVVFKAEKDMRSHQ